MTRQQIPFEFTEDRIDALPTPEESKRHHYHDTNVNGLVLMVTSTGHKSFNVQKKVKGVSIRFTIGKYPDISIRTARNYAIIIIAEVAMGRNPMAKIRDLKEENAQLRAMLRAKT